MSYLDFEKPVVEIKKKIEGLKKLMKINDIDFTNEVLLLEKRLIKIENEVYQNLTPWQQVQIARHPQRPTTLDYFPYLFENFLELHGDRYYGDDQAIVGGIAKFEGLPVTVIGHQRGRNTKENVQRNFGMPHPEGYRKALRLMKQAEKFNRPIITFLDTKGAYPGTEAEKRGQSQALANNIFEMSGLKVPIICIVIGEGASGGALGIGVGNHLHILENSWFSVISPEGAGALLWKDSSKAQLAADTMKITGSDLKELGIIDQLIEEVKGGAHTNHQEQAQLVKQAIRGSLEELGHLSETEIVEHRRKKYREVGEYSFLFSKEPVL
ncbi:acetyl-CoA carboxylase carboxyl transferase subunit alpha [Sutcliffiella halmapala]|uniref:acetyl-CoA carboxylase carboxyl transferase subunit alpha n=1 Tax=Sutcliffiella halmapala TaxID=79882 RepID=UPI001F47694B|nr:acetyl-CoA carboxylase carboxyl transferase subunit alpha [Sutcliffiella halmapala]